MNPKAPKNIDEYIAGFPQDIQEVLENIRAAKDSKRMQRTAAADPQRRKAPSHLYSINNFW